MRGGLGDRAQGSNTPLGVQYQNRIALTDLQLMSPAEVSAARCEVSPPSFSTHRSDLERVGAQHTETTSEEPFLPGQQSQWLLVCTIMEFCWLTLAS